MFLSFWKFHILISKNQYMIPIINLRLFDFLSDIHLSKPVFHNFMYLRYTQHKCRNNIRKKTNNNWYEIFPHFCITIYLFIDSILFIHDFSVRFSVVKTMMMQRFFVLVRDVTCESRFVSMVRETKKNKIENWKSKVIKVLSKTFISDSRWLEFKCSNLLSLILPVGM